jgi:hypothetical protein
MGQAGSAEHTHQHRRDHDPHCVEGEGYPIASAHDASTHFGQFEIHLFATMLMLRC